MNWVTFGVQRLRVLLGIVWFGYSLLLAVLIPAVSSLPIATQRQFGAAITKRATPIIDVLMPAIVVLGFIRGTFLGRIPANHPGASCAVRPFGRRRVTWFAS